MVMPGDNTDMLVELIQPIAMDEGLRFAIREGGRTVGAAGGDQGSCPIERSPLAKDLRFGNKAVACWRWQQVNGGAAIWQLTESNTRPAGGESARTIEGA